MVALGTRADRRGVRAGRAGARVAAGFGPYTLQGGRFAPCTPKRPARPDTDWAQIVGLYDVLIGGAVTGVRLNRAAAVAMRDTAPRLVSRSSRALSRARDLESITRASARAELCRRLGRTEEARASIIGRSELTRQEAGAALPGAAGGGVAPTIRPSVLTAMFLRWLFSRPPSPPSSPWASPRRHLGPAPRAARHAREGRG